MEPKAKKTRLDGKISNIITMDNDTLMEVFKYLNYCQLATSNLVTKRFRDLIRAHRHKLALLYVNNIGMHESSSNAAGVKIFDKQLSPEEYNEWVLRNRYSKQMPFDIQIAEEESTQIYLIETCAFYKDLNSSSRAFNAGTKLNHENWPLFQHFIRLVTDPFIYIRCLGLTSQIDILNLLTVAINSDRKLIQCEVLTVNLKGNMQKFMSWLKDNVLCKEFYITSSSGSISNYDAELLDLFMTGANCTSKINVKYYDISQVVVNFVQKFMELRNCDDFHIIQSIDSTFLKCFPFIEALKRNYAEFIVKQEQHYFCRLILYKSEAPRPSPWLFSGLSTRERTLAAFVRLLTGLSTRERTQFGWIANAWESLTREAIQKSFKTCGITNNPDGSEDHRIHCLRPEGSIPLGQELLHKARLEKDVEVIIPEEPDEDEDLNNGYKSDENLAQ
ncbi:hypothetical protein Ddc_22927 [Ditylenchus destructor]|nr:hypothetical protein Ddc_22927 [Ditylenchus destructor]